MNDTTDIAIRINGTVGHITLTRPKALNALSHQMALDMETALLAWQSDPTITCVLVDAEGEKAFCAGGDILKLYEQGMAGDYASGIQFWRDEYRLNALMDAYAKPIIAIMHGIVMGGGVGISAHCSHRIVTDNTLFALPECSIGLVPDVGSTHLLAQAPGHIGEYLGLTGKRLSADDAIWCGVADHYVPQDQLAPLKAAILANSSTDAIDDFTAMPGDGELKALEADISAVFALESLGAIIEKLAQMTDDWAVTAKRKIEAASPLSCAVFLWLVRAARQDPGLRKALTREFGYVSRAMQHGDFLEGIRASVVDKDRTPKWMHKTAADIPDALMTLMQSEGPGGALLF